MRGPLQGHSPDWKRTWTWKMEMDFKLNLKPNASDIFVNLYNIYNYTHVFCCIAVKYKSCSHVKWIRTNKLFLSVVLCRKTQGKNVFWIFCIFIFFNGGTVSFKFLFSLLWTCTSFASAGSWPREQGSFYWISQRHLAITQYSPSFCSLTKGITQNICRLCFCPNK